MRGCLHSALQYISPHYMIDQAPLSNAKGARGMSEKHDEKCLNPGARPLIINAEHDLRKLHIEHKIRASFRLRHILFLASYPELRICRGIRFPFSMIYVRQSLDNSADGCSPRQRLRPADTIAEWFKRCRTQK